MSLLKRVGTATLVTVLSIGTVLGGTVIADENPADIPAEVIEQPAEENIIENNIENVQEEAIIQNNVEGEKPEDIEEPVEEEKSEDIEELVEEEKSEDIEEPVEEEKSEDLEEPVEEELSEDPEEPVEEELSEDLEELVEEDKSEDIEEPVEEKELEDLEETVVEETVEEVKEDPDVEESVGQTGIIKPDENVEEVKQEKAEEPVEEEVAADVAHAANDIPNQEVVKIESLNVTEDSVISEEEEKVEPLADSLNIRAYTIGKDGERLHSNSIEVGANQSVTLTVKVEATDMSKIAYEWELDGTIIEGANSASYTTPPISGINNYSCKVYNVDDYYGDYDIVTFNIFVDNQLDVRVENGSMVSWDYVIKGENVELKVYVKAKDMNGLKYRWYDNYDIILGANGPSYSTNVPDSYFCVVEDRYGNSARCDFIVGYFTGFAYRNGKWKYYKDGEFQSNYTGFGSGFINEYDVWYVENGILDLTREDVVHATYGGEDGWYYVKDGRQSYATTVAKNSSGWWYIKNGKVDFSFTGVADNDNGTWYCEGGKVNFNKTDVVNAVTQWGYSSWFNIVNGKVTPGPTIAKNSNGWWYIDKSGEVNFYHTGVENNAYGWWYVKDGKVDFGFNGFAENQNGTWYCEGGKVNFNKTDVVKTNHSFWGDGWYNVVNGKLVKGPTVAKNSSGWWYINSLGKVDFDYTGVAQNAYGWWYCHNGKVDFSFNGFGRNLNGRWYCEGGKVNFNKNGVIKGTNYDYKDRPEVIWCNVAGGKVIEIETVAQNENGWWYINYLGQVNFNYTGLAQNANGWWYCNNGKVDFTYTGLAYNRNGRWYCQNGKVNFNYTGTYTDKWGMHYRIVNGKVQE